MGDFVWLITDFYQGIFNKLQNAIILTGYGFNDVTSIGTILFACIVIGFVVSLFWKGAKA